MIVSEKQPVRGLFIFAEPPKGASAGEDAERGSACRRAEGGKAAAALFEWHVVNKQACFMRMPFLREYRTVPESNAHV